MIGKHQIRLLMSIEYRELELFNSVPMSPEGRELAAPFEIEIQPTLRTTLIALEHGKTNWSFNLCSALKHLWRYGYLSDPLSDLNVAKQYLAWESADINAGIVQRSPKMYDQIWQVIGNIYIKRSELKR